MTIHSTITPAAPVHDARLGNVWAHNLRTVADHILFIRQHLATIDQRDETLPGTAIRRHSARYVDQCRKDLAYLLPRYLEAVRRVSEAEQKMDLIGMPYALSSHDWRAA